MKRETSAERLRAIMSERNLRQVDVLALVEPWSRLYGVPFFKQNLSSYLTGKVEPAQDKLLLLGRALNVSEAWLMGFDVPRERSAKEPGAAPELPVSSLSPADLQNLAEALEDAETRDRLLAYAARLADLLRLDRDVDKTGGE